ncbi:MAG: phosphoribosylaminoimidazolesuccinocarboxamide synthase [Desulfomicrobium sp.]|nr:phosphoribosylaminoimidazolesuccinocarboxamide synthase [Pseudomonadota bacterium]MBV1711630.1 phosphoribosylaminoimidazolesuccinocarboxamide synthase [Desulfomicrobium sp.]MBU4569694.1 phosphoribosylaminoimidazolesuccinocarboxamide synthase [Pseudomonadota bacterium]MBU4595414.1 phosphoribosylaminoimidazolesuccinocarboxamide synthase [Pseudomonadota bacterium]MBV1718705.1 phosphoribosylaminoimidazolesuccinocarboxamide synthase [Desulfomicrobium sp.]
MKIVTKTQIREFPLLSRGKVRDIYEIDPQTLLIVTTDRMSAFDVIMNEPIPYKGVVLNQITLFWMDAFKDLAANHLLATDVRDFPAALAPHADELEGRSVLVRKAKPLPIECIVRGYLTGSGFKDYKATGAVCGYKLPAGLVDSDKLETPLFTPSTKADLGAHDENITVADARSRIGDGLLKKIQELSLAIYSRGRDLAAQRGIIIADTKFEFGLNEKDILLIDEVLTPDSSRFWPADKYVPGQAQPSFDKQYLRDWLSGTGWDKTPPPPALPAEVIAETQKKYLEAYELLTGSPLQLP